MFLMLSLLCCAVYWIFSAGVDQMLTAEVKTDQKTEKISLWVGKEKEAYVFLPSYASMSSVKLHATKRAIVKIGAAEIVGEMDCGALQLNVPYDVTYTVWGQERCYTLTFVQSASLATMYLDTEQGDMDYIHSRKRNEEAGALRVYSTDGMLEFEGAVKSIAGRGNTTWDGFEKKPYTIDLGAEVDLLGMGAASDWVLLANADDPSGMRNRIILDFAAEAGMPYTADSEWVDLYLNGSYAGMYLLTEQNEVHSERIDIAHPDSFLVSLEREGRMVSQNLPYILTEGNQAIRVRYPKEQTDIEKSRMQQIWQTVEDAIVNDAAELRWLDLIDLDSWVKIYLIEEISGSLDACYTSVFFYRDGIVGDERIYAGPVWDYDLSMGRTWHTDGIDFLWANRLRVSDEFNTPWFHALYQKGEFQTRMKEVFRDEFLPLLNELCEKVVDEYDAQISVAARMNGIRWQTESYDEDVQTIRSFLARRISFLTQLWMEGKEYHIVEAHSDGVSYAYFAVTDGMSMENLPVLESSGTRTFLGWYDENGEVFDQSMPIYENMTIYAGWDGASTAITLYAQYVIPLAIIACMGVGILCADIRRSGKGG